MAYGSIQSITLTTDGSGNATGVLDGGYGYINAIIYTKNNFANGVGFTVTGETSGIAIWTGSAVNASTTVRPRAATHDITGAASLYAAAGTPVNDRILVAGERIKIVVASGGSAFSGTITVVLGD